MKIVHFYLTKLATLLLSTVIFPASCMCRYFFLLICLVGLIQCTSLPEQPKLPGFYYWKTQMRFDSTAWRNLSHLSGQQPLYLRVFDVDYNTANKDAVPVGDLAVSEKTSVTDGRPIIPVVYFTNRVFENLKEEQVRTLAQKTCSRILQHLDSWKTGNCLEIQIDCDWTATTRDRYFQFLEAFRANAAPKKVSCTVRLHQYRDRMQMGIPPVDRGMLMCYNVADPKNVRTINSIFDPRLVKGYLKAPPYPLSLDVALPIFGWGSWFRGNSFEGLLSAWNNSNASDTTLYVQETPLRYRVLQDTVIGRDYLREGDLIRLDRAAATDLLEIADLLHTIRNADSRLVFFDWQPENIAIYEKIIPACAARFY